MIVRPWQKPPRGVVLNKSHPLAMGLVGCWLFNELDGDSVYDLSGNANYGTLKNAMAWAADGVEADGDTAHIDVGSAAILDDIPEVTLVTLVKFKSLSLNDRLFFKGWARYWRVRGGAGDEIELQVDTTGVDADSITNCSLLSTGVWISLAATYSDSGDRKARLYANGKEVSFYGTQIAGTGTPSGDAALTCEIAGSNQEGADAIFAYYYIYNRALTEQEIAWLHREPYAMFMNALYQQYWYLFHVPSAPATETLTIQDPVHSQIADVVSTVETYGLSVVEPVHTTLSDVPSTVKTFGLSVIEPVHSSISDVAAISTTIDLTVQDPVHDQIADTVSTAETYGISVIEPVHTSLADVVELTPTFGLSVIEPVHSGLADVVAISTAVNLTIQDPVHDQIADNVDTTQTFGLQLQEPVHSGIADVISLNRYRTATVQDAVHDQLADANIAAQRSRQLIAQDPVHDQLADANVAAQRSRQLTVQDPVSEQLADVIDLQRIRQMRVQDSVHDQIASIVRLGTGVNLTVQDPVHTVFQDTITLSVGITYPVMLVVGNDREYRQTAQGDSYYIVAEDVAYRHAANDG